MTQSFNTTSSMGRLTLNVLLSFAQFEREVTGERIRDKIAASKKKGLWMGGHVPLGYKAENRRLVIDNEEAGTVRLIFERYLALGSLPALQQELRERAIRTRARPLASGKIVGGGPFTNGPLAHLLRNRVYVGEINHKDRSHPGDHDAIIGRDLFDAVQTKLQANHHPKNLRLADSGGLLVGRIYDDRGNRMTPTHASKRGVRYRYYTSCVLAQGRRQDAGSVPRVPAPEIEVLVLSALRMAAREGLPPPLENANSDLIYREVDRVIVHQDHVEIRRISTNDVEMQPAIMVPWSPVQRRPKRSVTIPAGSDLPIIRAEARARLLEGVAKARRWLDELVAGTVTDTKRIAQREGCSERSVRMTLNLAFLAPRIVEAALNGTLPHAAGITRLIDGPVSWRAQTNQLVLISERGRRRAADS